MNKRPSLRSLTAASMCSHGTSPSAAFFPRVLKLQRVIQDKAHNPFGPGVRVFQLCVVHLSTEFREVLLYIRPSISNSLS